MQLVAPSEIGMLWDINWKLGCGNQPKKKQQLGQSQTTLSLKFASKSGCLCLLLRAQIKIATMVIATVHAHS